MKSKKELHFQKTEIGTIPIYWDVGLFEKDLEIKGRIGWRGYKTSDLRESGPVVIGGKNLKSSYFMVNDFKHLSREKYEESPDIMLKKGDILLVTRGNLGEVGFFDGSIGEATVNPSVIILTNFDGDSCFLFYYLISPQGKRNVLTLSSGSSVPAIYQADVKQLMYPKPPLSEQKKISDFLFKLDRKIEINYQMNKNLYQLGKTIFKHWFIDFEFPDKEGKPYKSSGGKLIYNEKLVKEIPIAWKVKSIDEIADFLNGLAMQKFPAKENEESLPVIKIRELKQGITKATNRANLDVPKEYIITDGDVLFSWSGSLKVVLWGYGKGALNQHLFKVTSSEYPKWFFYYWILKYLPEYRHIASGKATTMGHIRRHHLTNSLVAVPDKKTLKKTDKMFAPIIKKIITNKIETRTLTQIRDSLLPKLMSGKIRVPITEDDVRIS